jgi:nitroimidazol reductase NimA-like FMN-containing flavoprotein (pyridoxamine 5'-phosphate oxidase superfamily)
LAAATTVGYVNDGLTIYFLCSPQSQKAANLARDSRISLTIDHDVFDPMAITGLSMAAQAQPVTDPTEVAKAMNCSERDTRNMRRSRCRNRRTSPFTVCFQR